VRWAVLTPQISTLLSAMALPPVIEKL